MHRAWTAGRNPGAIGASWPGWKGVRRSDRAVTRRRSLVHAPRSCGHHATPSVADARRLPPPSGTFGPHGAVAAGYRTLVRVTRRRTRPRVPRAAIQDTDRSWRGISAASRNRRTGTSAILARVEPEGPHQSFGVGTISKSDRVSQPLDVGRIGRDEEVEVACGVWRVRCDWMAAVLAEC
jgi:hypothetical protein